MAAPAREQALGLASRVAEKKWRSKKGNAKVADRLEEHMEEGLACLAFRESHRRRIRTTNNGPERLDQEIKRRAHAGGEDLLPQPRVLLALGEGACGRAVGGVGNGQALLGHGRAKREQRRKEREEVALMER